MKSKGDKKSFILYSSYADIILDMTDEQAGALMKALYCYHLGRDMPEMDKETMMAFRFISETMKRDSEKYAETIRKRSEAGKKGNAARWGKEKGSQNIANATFAKQKIANIADNVNDNVNVNDNIKDIVTTPERSGAATPSFEQGSFEMECVEKLIQSCLEGYPNSKVPRTPEEKQKWAVEIGRMKRIDNRSEYDILQALNFAINDVGFWKSNIRSAKKFREKFETLFLQSNNLAGKGAGIKKNSFNDFRHHQDYDMAAIEKKLISNLQ